MLSDRLPHKTDAGAVSDHFLIESPRYRITNGFAIGSLDRFIQMVFGRV